MPESAQPLRKLKNYISDSSCDSSSSVSESGEESEKEDHNEKKEKKVSYDLGENKCKSLERSGKGILQTILAFTMNYRKCFIILACICDSGLNTDLLSFIFLKTFSKLMKIHFEGKKKSIFSCQKC